MSAKVKPVEPQVVDNEEFIPLFDYQFLGNNFTVERKMNFLRVYYRKASIAHAAASTGVSRRAVYDWIGQDAQFAEALENAKVDTKEFMESSVYERAYRDPILAMFWLKAHDSKYRDRLQVDVEQVDSEIRERLQRLQLPAATTEFVDTRRVDGSFTAIPSPAPTDQKEHT